MEEEVILGGVGVNMAVEMEETRVVAEEATVVVAMIGVTKETDKWINTTTIEETKNQKMIEVQQINCWETKADRQVLEAGDALFLHRKKEEPMKKVEPTGVLASTPLDL